MPPTRPGRYDVVVICRSTTSDTTEPTTAPVARVPIEIVAGEPFELEPAAAAGLSAVQLAGSGCAGAAARATIELWGGPTGGVLTLGTAAAASDGRWSTEVVVPPIASGEYRVEIYCSGGALGFAYAAQAFTIVPGVVAALSVSPNPVQATREVQLTNSGTLCRYPSASVAVSVDTYPPYERMHSSAPVFVENIVPDEEGSWNASVVLADPPPGTYTVSAACRSGSDNAFSTSTTLVVLPAVWVSGAPFTG